MPAAVARGSVDFGPSHLAQLVERVGERRFFFLVAVGQRKLAPEVAEGKEGRLMLGRLGNIRWRLKPLAGRRQAALNS